MTDFFKENTNFNKAALLTAARIFGIMFSLFIPMYLGRKLSIETYGTYKQIMLFFWFSNVALNLGLDDSTYYFIRKDPRNFPLYSLNALIFNLIVTALIWMAFSVFKVEISQLIGNKELVNYLPLLGFLTLTTVTSMQIEGILFIGLNRFKERLMIEIGTEFLKSMAIIAAFYFYNSIEAVLILLSLLMSFRLLLVIVILNYCKNKNGLSIKNSPKFIIQQIKFGLPLGLSRIFQNILNMENYFISAFFSLSQFTYYSVGCFENPLVNAARSSIYELGNIDMVDAMKNSNKSKAILVWKSMNRKLIFIIVPFIVYMVLFSKEIILFIFSNKYLPSVPFFMIFNIYLFVGILNPEPIFRATNKTFLALKIKIIGLLIGVLLIISGAYWGGAIYALAGKILGVFLMNLAGLIFSAHLLDTNVLNLFNLKIFSQVFLISLVTSTLLRLVFLHTTWIPFWVLATSFSLYVLIMFILSCWINLIKEEEIDYLKIYTNKIFLKFKINSL